MKDSENTRKIILEKARELFLKEGFHKTSMRAIAKSAGVSTWPLYTHFKNKSEVFIAICLEGYDYLIQLIVPILNIEEPAPSRLKQIFYVYREFYYNMPQYSQLIRLALNPLSGIYLPDELQKKLFEKELEIQKIKEKIISEGIKKGEIRDLNIEAFALFMNFVASGILQINDAWIAKQMDVDTDAITEQMLNFVGNAMVPFVGTEK